MPKAWQTMLFKRLMEITWVQDRIGKRPRALWILGGGGPSVSAAQRTRKSFHALAKLCVQSQRKSIKDNQATNHPRHLPRHIDLLSGVQVSLSYLKLDVQLFYQTAWIIWMLPGPMLVFIPVEPDFDEDMGREQEDISFVFNSILYLHWPNE